MKIRRIPKDELDRGFCHDCHSPAELEVNFGSKRPVLRLCMRDARYMGGVVLSRVGEHEQGLPIPKPGERINSQELRK
jgi:hypothetical protein